MLRKKGKKQSVEKTLDEAKAKEQRSKFKELYGLCREWNVTDAEISLMMAVSTLEGEFNKMQNTLKVADMNAEVEDEMVKEVLQLLAGSSLYEAKTYISVLQNAMQFHTRQKNKELFIKDLKVQLLDPETGKPYEAS